MIPILWKLRGERYLKISVGYEFFFILDRNPKSECVNIPEKVNTSGGYIKIGLCKEYGFVCLYAYWTHNLLREENSSTQLLFSRVFPCYRWLQGILFYKIYNDQLAA